jgi:predicted Ser/Thr protein kinase
LVNFGKKMTSWDLSKFKLNFGDITIGNCIGKGGQGVVYSGIYQSRVVALKNVPILNEKEVEFSM